MKSETLVFLLLAGSPALLAASPDKVAKTEEQPRYDPMTVIDVMAAVTDVREMPRGSPLSGVHLAVKAESETMDIYLGPIEFVKQFDIRFIKGDQIQIIGSKVKLGSGASVVLAREVRKDEITLYCRQKRGEPNWEPWGSSPK